MRNKQTQKTDRWMVMTFTMDFFYGTPEEIIQEMLARFPATAGETPREYMDGYADRAMVWKGVKTDIRVDTPEHFLVDAERYGLLWIDRDPHRSYYN